MQQHSDTMPQSRLRKPANTAKRIFFAVFFVVFLILLVEILFNNMHFSYSPAVVLALAAVWLAVVWGLWQAAQKLAPVLRRREKLFCGLFFVLLAAVLALVYSQVACFATIDYERVFNGAINYTVNGFIEEPYLDYFYKYPHNLSLLVVFQFVFRVFHRVGFSNFYLIVAVLNGLCYLATFFFVYLCLRRLFGVPEAFFGVCVLLLCLPLLATIPVVYTDTVSMPFIPFAIYCALRAKAEAGWRRWGLAVLVLSFGVALGMKIKYSVVIVFVAIVLDLLLSGAWKKVLASVASLLVFYLVLNTGFNAFIYANILDKEKAADAATPFASWIMMGLKGDGAHNPDDNLLIWAEETAEGKQRAAMDEIQRRLTEMGPAGLAAHLNQKALRSFGAGHLDADLWVGLAPMQETPLAGMLYSESDTFVYFKYAAQGYYVMLLGLVVLGAGFAVRRRNYVAFVPYLAWFGLFLFLLMWEAAPRYLLNYYGALIPAAVFGAQQLFGWADTSRQKRRAAKRVPLPAEGGDGPGER